MSPVTKPRCSPSSTQPRGATVRRPLLERALTTALALVSAGALAQPDMAAQMTVRELMHLDAELARKQARQRLNAVGSASTPPDAPMHAGSAGLRVEAIYGVGKKLLAEVRIGARNHVYMHGHALPIGGKADPATYMLRGISGSCVHLERADDSQTLCLRPSLWSAKP